MKCLYEFKQSKLKSEIINLLQAEIADIDFNVKENRKKVSQCNIFFGSMLLGGEITPKQFMSIVAMDSYVQDQTLDLLTFMKGHERRRFCCQVEQNGFDIDDLFNLHQKRQTYLLPGSKKCIICDFRNNVRQMFVRNENKLLVVAKKRAVDWKSMNDLLPYKMKLFCFNYDGMRLSIHFSNDAQSYLYMEKDLPPIDIHLLCTNCHEEVERFVATEVPPDLRDNFTARRKLELMKSEWFRIAKSEEKKKDMVVLLEKTFNKNREEIISNKRIMMSELKELKTRKR